MTEILLVYWITINIVTFFVYGVDKWRSTASCLPSMGRKKVKHGRHFRKSNHRSNRRISEKNLLLLAVFGGSIGAMLGMKIWHHKTLHKKFKYGLPLILLIQVALIYFIKQSD